ncbi:15167_t:CDS:2, partial [Funneliformis mosseae]
YGKPSTTYKWDDLDRCFIEENKTESSASQQYNKHYLNEENYFDENHYDKTTFYPKFFSENTRSASIILETVEKLKNKKLVDSAFNHLINEFPAKRLLKYEKSKEFVSLSKNQKRCIKFTINEMLRMELSQEEKKLSLPVKVYITRGILPSLPNGIKSYTEFQNTNNYKLLSDLKKKRINKIALAE